MKNENSFRNLLRRLALFYVFINLFTVSLNRKQLDYHTCLCIQSVAICCFKYIKKIQPHADNIIQREMTSLIAFSEKCEYSTNKRSLKVIL